MAKQWNLSCYTNVIECDSGEILLHNSFMGAVARISARQYKDIKRFMAQGFKEADMTDYHALEELRDNGFFVPSNSDEREKITELMDKERETIRFSMIILPHENCNFRCVYCYEKFERGRMKPDIVKGLKLFVDKKVKETPGLKELKVSWFGGEPLLAKDIICELSAAFYASCKKNGVSYISGGMSTNGYLLTPKMADLLLDCRIKSFQVTLDGPESIHDSNRKRADGGKTYKQILDNLANMRKRKDDFFVRIRVNFNNDSASFVQKWLDEEISPLFSNDPRFALSFHGIGKWGGRNDASLDTCDYASASLFKSRFIAKARTCNFSNQIVKELLMPHGNVCYAGRESSIVVGSDGTIYKCTVAFDDPRNSVGKLTRDGRLIIDKNLWDLWTKTDNKDTSWCRACSFYPSCQGRNCPLAAMNQNRPACPMTKKEYEALIMSAVSAKT